jgi:Ca-activated chloride channel family protein
MSAKNWAYLLKLVGLGALVLVPLLYCLAEGRFSPFTPDQRGYRSFVREDYQEAAKQFADPMWNGTALFKQGEFEEAAGVFAGYDTADAAFNQGNALVMLGKYVEAADRYARALELQPDWEAANVNREIALGRARAVKKEGGDMTGGEMGADEIVFTEGKAPPSAGEEQIEEGQKLSDAEVRAVWLRQVQTKPADFLRAKFAYQYATRETRED